MNKKNFIVLIILCIFLCIVSMYVVLINEYKNKEKQDVSIDGRTAENQLLLSGFGVFGEKYTGKLKTSEIIDKIEILTKQDIPKLYEDIKEYDDTKLEEYYETYSRNIKNRFGKKNVNEFKEFAKHLQSISINLNDWYSVKINRVSFVDSSDKNGYAYVEYELQLENEEKLNFSLYVAHENYTTPTFVIDVKN